jgi:serine/threonine protein kinase
MSTGTTNPAMPYSKLSPDLYPGYSLCRFLGNGGFGEVWSAQTHEGEPAALKFLSCVGRRGGLHELRSIQLVRPLLHPNLVQIKQVWAAREYLVVAMELADGSFEDLFDMYEEETGKPIPVDDLLPFLSQAANALDFLNAPQHKISGQMMGIQHGDISPGNLLVCDGTVKLSDFSLTTAFQGCIKNCPPAGKPAFAAPEVFKGRLSNRTDQYALAITYCWLRSGRLPFSDTPELFDPTYKRPAPDLSMLTKEERPAIERALAAQPNDRWNSCRDMVSQVMLSTSASRCAESPHDRRKHKRRPVSQKTSCRLLLTGGSASDTAMIKDISRDGIRVLVFETQFANEPGAIVSLALTKKTAGVFRFVRMRIARKEAVGESTCIVAGEFDSQLAAEDLRGLTE